MTEGDGGRGIRNLAQDAAERARGGDDNPLLADDAPIRALGYGGHGHYFVLDAGRSIRAVSPRSLGPRDVADLAGGRIDWLEAQFPRSGGRDSEVGWNNTDFTARLFAACRELGDFDPVEDPRGPGVWRYKPARAELDPPEGAPPLVVNTGNGLEFEGGLFDAGRWLGRHLYVTARALVPPAERPADREAGTLVLDHLRKWAWREPLLAPELVLGHIGIQMMVGAVDHRPILWLSGPPGCGKSEVLAAQEAMQGGLGLKFEKVTYAGLRDDIVEAWAARPVYIDEFEAGRDPDKYLQVLEMARYAFYRGQGRMTMSGKTVMVNASFAFAAAKPPMLEPADASRTIALGLLKPDARAAAETDLKASIAALKRLGPGLRRRLVARWGDWAPILKAWRKGLAERGLEMRELDTYAGVLTAQFLVTSDDPLPADVDIKAWCDAIAKRIHHVRPMSAGQTFWQRLMTATVESAWRGGEQPQVGVLVQRALVDKDPDALRFLKARCGIAVTRFKGQVDAAGEPLPFLAVADEHAGLENIVKRTNPDWAGGHWRQALEELPGAIRMRVRYGPGSDQVWSTCIPAQAFQRDGAYDDVVAGNDYLPAEDIGRRDPRSPHTPHTPGDWKFARARRPAGCLCSPGLGLIRPCAVRHAHPGPWAGCENPG